MDVSEFVGKAAAAGILIAIKGDRLIIRPSGNPILVDIVKKYKHAFIAYLQETTVCSHPYTVHKKALPNLKTPLDAGVCIACGYPWGKHGCPVEFEWNVVDDPASVQLLTPTFMAASFRKAADEADLTGSEYWRETEPEPVPNWKPNKVYPGGNDTPPVRDPKFSLSKLYEQVLAEKKNAKRGGIIEGQMTLLD